MDKNQNISEQAAPDCLSVSLMDGRELSCALKAQQPDIIKSCELELDTTGQYLSIGGKPKTLSSSDESKAERQYNHRIFTENAWFFLDNAERIFSDSRMFFAPVKVSNGLAYVGDSPFKNPTLGIYLEWWQPQGGCRRCERQSRVVYQRLAVKRQKLLLLGESRRRTC